MNGNRISEMSEGYWFHLEHNFMILNVPVNLINLVIFVSSMASMSPNNFSWVEPGKLAGLALPRMTCEYQYLLDNGIKHLVCLCERKPPYHDSCPELQLHHIKIADFTPPSPSQIDRFLSIVEEANSKGEVRAQMLDRLWLTNCPAYKVLSVLWGWVFHCAQAYKPQAL